jgi:hypothetical protein
MMSIENDLKSNGRGLICRSSSKGEVKERIQFQKKIIFKKIVSLAPVRHFESDLKQMYNIQLMTPFFFCLFKNVSSLEKQI